MSNHKNLKFFNKEGDYLNFNYNEGYESAIKDIMKILNGKTTSKKQKQIYEELVNELMNSFEKHKE